MAGGSIGDIIGLKEEIITKACDLAFKRNRSRDDMLYNRGKVKISSDTYRVFSFKGSFHAAEWFVKKPFGQTEIDRTKFPSLRSVGNDEDAFVNEGFAVRFKRILETGSFKSEVENAIRDGEQVVFTGHSSGAAIATLATFWALEVYFNPTKQENRKPPFCVTFGSPLVGNHIFSHASRRENWSRYFIHFVWRYDIVPRILLAPFSSIENNFNHILQLLNPQSKTCGQDHTGDAVVSEFYTTVMQNAATVTSHAACILMGSTNLLVADFVELSTYRPFGTYIFCNGHGQAGQLTVVKNSDAVLQLLFHTAQLSSLEQREEVANNSIQQHLCYENKLRDSLEGVQNVVYLDQLTLKEIPLSAHAASDGLGLSQKARLYLRAAAELEARRAQNEKNIKFELVENNVKDLEKYRETKERKKVCYYDGFREHELEEDFIANVKRLELAGVWDAIIEKLRNYELPDEFEGKKEIIDLATRFRILVEPLDIANYYRHVRNYEEPNASYMVKGRPKRYRYPQRWSEHVERRTKEDISASCFWGEVEELHYETNTKKVPFNDVKERVEQLEARIKDWNKENELKNDVFLEGSTLVKWWKSLPPDHKNQSCIRSLFQESH